MKQIIAQEGVIKLINVPRPTPKTNEVLVKTQYSLISSGTELSGASATKHTVLKELLNNSEKRKKALQIFKQKGVTGIIDKKKRIKSSQLELGYSLCGRVVEIGADVTKFKKNEIVACVGAGKANHAEYVCVSENLIVKVPKKLDSKSASSVALGSIAMQALRRTKPELNEKIAVIGLGLIGQILVQLLKTCGTSVIGFDIDDNRVQFSKRNYNINAFNSQKINIEKQVKLITSRMGVDATIIAASAPFNNSIIQQAMKITRKKGRVIILGDVGLYLERNPFYEKEIDLLISTSYGPGRYDPLYEDEGIDYPYHYVRWTENRNMQSYLDLLLKRDINFDNLIIDTVDIDHCTEAYELLKKSKSGKSAVILDYGNISSSEKSSSRISISKAKIKSTKILQAGVIGLGNFAQQVHLPNLLKMDDVNIRALCRTNPVQLKTISNKFNSNYCTTNYKEMIEDPLIDFVIITLPHDLHAQTAIEAIEANKSVFCEKPMALNKKDVKKIILALSKSNCAYTVGFNRRFSPLIQKIKKQIEHSSQPILATYFMNAGFIPQEHWTQKVQGGGRNLGEACHIYDLFTYLTGKKVKMISANSISNTEQYQRNDNFSVNLKFDDGSLCNLVYSAMGNKTYPKEKMVLLHENNVYTINDYENPSSNYLNKIFYGRNILKGHREELLEFVQSIKKGRRFNIPLWQLVQATEISFAVEKQLDN